jgi:hypothetical protein
MRLSGHNWRRLLGIAIAATPMLGLIPAAQAAPEGTKIIAFRLPCDGAVCDPQSDAQIPNDSTVSGRVQLQTASSAAVGLRSVELQVQVGTDWRCVRRWSTSARDFRAHQDLDTTSRLGGCSSDFSNGENGVYRFRALAEDRTGAEQSSSVFNLRVENEPQVPRWADSPKGIFTTQGPRVTLRWQANTEPDIVEYHFVRSGSGREVELAISADRPGGQGCAFDGGVYECIDDAFTSSDEGTYRYALIAYRHSPSSSKKCSLPGGGNCIESKLSEVRTVTVTAPKAGDTTTPPPPPPSAREQQASGGSRSGGSRPPSRPAGPTLSDLAAGEDFCFECGEFDEELPYESPVIVDDRQPSDADLVLPGEDENLQAFDPELAAALEAERMKRGLVALSAGLLLLLMGLHLARVLRDPSKTHG